MSAEPVTPGTAVSASSRHAPGVHVEVAEMSGTAVGIDVGGSSIKGGLINPASGELLTDVLMVPTPAPSTPELVIGAVEGLIARAGAAGSVPVGITVPAPVVRGRVPYMANLDQAWVGLDVSALVHARLGHRATVLNDADAAALGEATFGAAAGVAGTVIVTTLGTGIGSGIVVDGVLVPNVELGHLEIDGHDAESRASARQKSAGKLSWADWSARLQRYYSHVEDLFFPDLFVVGGAISASASHFLPLLDLRTPIVPAVLQNRAGIVGAAHAAVRNLV